MSCTLSVSLPYLKILSQVYSYFRLGSKPSFKRFFMLDFSNRKMILSLSISDFLKPLVYFYQWQVTNQLLVLLA